MIVTCPICFNADDVSYQRLPDRQLAYLCRGRHESGRPAEWTRSLTDVDARWMAAEGVTDDLLQPMLACLDPSDGLLEYGIVEYRLRERFPDIFLPHIADRGHVALGTTSATASAVRFGMALSRLARTGDLAFDFGPATGAWSYNGKVSYWCRPPVTGRTRTTWVEWCQQNGRPTEWTDADRGFMRGPTV